jgi:hypothetical protein
VSSAARRPQSSVLPIRSCRNDPSELDPSDEVEDIAHPLRLRLRTSWRGADSIADGRSATAPPGQAVARRTRCSVGLLMPSSLLRSWMSTRLRSRPTSTTCGALLAALDGSFAPVGPAARVLGCVDRIAGSPPSAGIDRSGFRVVTANPGRELSRSRAPPLLVLRVDLPSIGRAGHSCCEPRALRSPAYTAGLSAARRQAVGTS